MGDKMAAHWATLRRSQAEGITYDDAAGRIAADEQLADGTQRTPHMAALLRLQAKGCNQSSADFGRRYEAELIAMGLDAERAEATLDGLLATARAARIAREATAQRPALAALPGGRAPAAQGSGVATPSTNGKAYRPRASHSELAILTAALTEGAAVAQGRSVSVPAFAQLRISGNVLPFGVANALTPSARDCDVAKFKAIAFALVNSITVADDRAA